MTRRCDSLPGATPLRALALALTPAACTVLTSAACSAVRDVVSATCTAIFCDSLWFVLLSAPPKHRPLLLALLTNAMCIAPVACPSFALRSCSPVHPVDADALLSPCDPCACVFPHPCCLHWSFHGHLLPSLDPLMPSRCCLQCSKLPSSLLVALECAALSLLLALPSPCCSHLPLQFVVVLYSPQAKLPSRQIAK
jgi:hypothetical protein